MDTIVNIINDLPDATRFFIGEYFPIVFNILIDAGYTVFEDFSIVP